MSLFGMMGMGDLDDDPIFGHHMRSMRQMNNMMNSLFNDPFGMMLGGGGGGAGFFPTNALMMSPNRGPMMGTQMNRLLGGDGYMDNGGLSYSSSSVFSMSSGPDGRPQIYQASSSTRTGPGGVKETRKTVQDSRSGTKKMAIGHHIGERAHILEKEQNVRTGQQEERQEFINLDDSDAEDFDREFQNKIRQGTSSGRLQITEVPSNVPAILPAIQSSEDIQQQNLNNRNRLPTPRRAIRSSPLASNASQSPTRHSHITTSVHPHPYQPQSRKSRALKGQYQHNNQN